MFQNRSSHGAQKLKRHLVIVDIYPWTQRQPISVLGGREEMSDTTSEKTMIFIGIRVLFFFVPTSKGYVYFLKY